MKFDSHKNLQALCANCHRSENIPAIGPDPRLKNGKKTIELYAKKAAHKIWHSELREQYQAITGVKTEGELRLFLCHNNTRAIHHRVMTPHEQEMFQHCKFSVLRHDRLDAYNMHILFSLCNKSIDVSSDDKLILKCRSKPNAFVINAVDDAEDDRAMQLVLDLLASDSIPALRSRESRDTRRTLLEQVRDDAFDDVKPSRNLKIFMTVFCAYKHYDDGSEFSRTYNSIAKMGTTNAVNRELQLDSWRDENYEEFKRVLNDFAATCHPKKFTNGEILTLYFLLYMRETRIAGGNAFVKEVVLENLPIEINGKNVLGDSEWWERCWTNSHTKNGGMGKTLWKRATFIQELKSLKHRERQYRDYLQRDDPPAKRQRGAPGGDDRA